MQRLIIQSSTSDTKLTLFDPKPKNIKHIVDGFNAKLDSHKIPPSECKVFGAYGNYLYEFFLEIIEDKKAIHEWRSIEDHLEIEARRNKDCVDLKIHLREGPWEENWAVSDTVTLDLDALKKLVPELKEFLRVQNVT